MPALKLYGAGFFMTEEEKYMKRAISLARRGAGWVSPNPMVGAILVRNGEVLGEGYHHRYGAPHAEVEAILNAGVPVAGATLYVTLEPCNHHGKTPPCSERIVQEGITRVVYGMADPNPGVAGGGAGFLMHHGIAVKKGVLEAEIRMMNEVYLKYITTRQPFVVLKTAMTLDGKIATVTNASRWITGAKSRNRVHHLRQELSAIMVGVDTVIADDPLLNIRLKGRSWRNPLKVIADTHARIPLNASVLLNEPHLTLVAVGEHAPVARIRELERKGVQVLVCPEKLSRVDLNWLMQALAAMEIDSVMIEGGSTLAFSAIRSGIVDKLITFIAPKLLGGAGAPTPLGGEGYTTMEEAVNLHRISYRKMGHDLMLEGYLKP